MAFTTPRDWTGGEFVTESMLDTHIRDNFLAMGYHLIARKTSDEADSTGTAQPDDQLFTPSIPANEAWMLRWIIVAVEPTGDMRVQVTFPSGDFYGSVSTTTPGLAFLSGTGTQTSSLLINGNNGTPGYPHFLEGLFVNGGTPGAVALKWARGASGTCTVKANSTLWGVKLA